jgi:uncharacterized protein YbcC (UPF0753/DUF2309 family)
MSTETEIRERIDSAASTVGRVWPLHSFVTANPLSGFEDLPFHRAVRQAATRFSGDGYPDSATFRRALADGRIDPDILCPELERHGYDSDPETSLSRLSTGSSASSSESSVSSPESRADRVDTLLTKWLAAFLDQGTAHWPMPNRERGFYAAFRSVARHDRAIPDRNRIAELPDEPVAGIERVLSGVPESRWGSVFEHHLTALPGWTGLIRQRASDGGDWQSAHPVTLTGYLAVRLALVDLLDRPVDPDTAGTGSDETGVPLAEVWLTAWERSYRQELVEEVAEAGRANSGAGNRGRPDAQLVFCIDTRSEIIRRHIETTGNYETHGYAGFFGVPMRYRAYDSGVTVDACPPILDPQHRVTDRPTGGTPERERHDTWSSALDAGADIVESLGSNAATAFSFVESAGVGYGLSLAARTLLPARVYDLLAGADERIPDDHEFCEPVLDHDPAADHALPVGLAVRERVEYAATAFELMGWEQFGRVVVFAGHASQTTNNPFDASLDCGACAGNPGGPSARVLATICNDETVRERLRERGVEIPADTVFVAGQHNTTTDEVELYATDVPESHEADIERLQADLERARVGAAAERAGDMGAGADAGVRETERRAADWAETRPEWGLAGNAAFVVGPRSLTADLDLDGRSFLHSYDWSTDPNGEALEAIVTGPMVVTQWINTQYYFATVDPAVYGSGSKVTHNPVGNVGVYQGNGGDLMTGLPLQSLMSGTDEPYHQPLRLSTVIHAPVERVTDVLAEHDEVTELLENNWLSLTVVDPQRDHRSFRFDGDLSWVDSSGQDPPTDQESTTSPTAVDD